jgi:hypothetical protein
MIQLRRREELIDDQRASYEKQILGLTEQVFFFFI